MTSVPKTRRLNDRAWLTAGWKCSVALGEALVVQTDHPSSMDAAQGPQKVHIAEGLFVFVLIGGFLLPWSIWIWFHFTPNTVLASADVGRFVSAGKGNDATNIQTTEGTIAIEGTLSALRGSRLSVQRSTKRGTELCVNGAPRSCIALAGPWTGPLHAIPGVPHAFDFYSAGISAYTLRIWLLFGCVTTLASLLAACVEIDDNRPEARTK